MTVLRWIGLALVTLIALAIVSAPVAAQLNRINPRQIICVAQSVLVGGAAGMSCTASPTISGTLTAGTVTATTLGGNKFIGAGFRLLTGFGTGLASLTEPTETSGQEINVGSATLGTCTGGTITTGSHNFAGGYTGNTSSSCVITFGTPNWTNAPFCVAMSIASTTHPRVSATATSSITITGGVSGEAITYLCSGRIGT